MWPEVIYIYIGDILWIGISKATIPNYLITYIGIKHTRLDLMIRVYNWNRIVEYSKKKISLIELHVSVFIIKCLILSSSFTVKYWQMKSKEY